MDIGSVSFVIINYLPEQVVSAQFPSPPVAPPLEPEWCVPLEEILALELPPGPTSVWSPSSITEPTYGVIYFLLPISTSLLTKSSNAGSNHFSTSTFFSHISFKVPCLKAFFIQRSHPIHSLSLTAPL